MADETKPAQPEKKAAPVPAPAKLEKVRLATHKGDILDLSAHKLGVVTENGSDFTPDDADTVRTIARKCGVALVEKEKN